MRGQGPAERETVRNSSYPVLNPPLRTLLGPGPSDIHPRVLRRWASRRSGIWIRITSR